MTGSNTERTPSRLIVFDPLRAIGHAGVRAIAPLVKAFLFLFRITLIIDSWSSFRGPGETLCELSEQEILALAISSEEDDSRIYRGFSEGLREQFPASAKVFDEMADEEVRHRTMLFDLYRSKFGDYLPLIRRQDVKGFVQQKPLWLARPLGLDDVRKY